MTNFIIPDSNERIQALDTTQSFIVQAPAGSGKTELLTQRYLALLGQAQQGPEEILALTFTRKAATEMRTRIIEALNKATDPAPESEHHKKTWELANKALLNSQQHHWNLLDNPNRLRIQTIDSLCAHLTKQLPLLSGFGANIAITEETEHLYAQAADQLLATLEQTMPWSGALADVLFHLDNNFERARNLFITMLAKRDQWLPHLTSLNSNPNSLREQLEMSLHHIITEHCLKLQQTFTETTIEKLIALATFAANTIKFNGQTSPLDFFIDITPNKQQLALPHWQAIAHLLLTQTGDWRKTITVTTGFPSPSSTKDTIEKQLFKDKKQSLLTLIEELSADDELHQLIKQVAYLPMPHYTDEQWQIIDALAQILPMLAAQCYLIFQQYHQVDFIEVNTAALQALGDEHAPSDLALSLDYRIQHILVDEFQDTSQSQFRLLEKLTAGWEPNDGRTLFLVGDPMQSIYRFREAKVGLFLRARQYGIGIVDLTPLYLQSNFRSTPTIIDWVNTTFCHVFPKHEDISQGAVSYHSSKATAHNDTNSYVSFHPVEDDNNEAFMVLKAVNEALALESNQSIAILVRAKTHLSHLIPLLQANHIDYQAVELEYLIEQSIIQDLLALTSALLHPANKTAWLAILRAPWCGLSLSDLHILSQSHINICIWDALKSEKIVQMLSSEGKIRLQRITDIIKHAFYERRRQSLANWVETTWLNLGGPACIRSENNLSHAKDYFDCLATMESGSDLIDFDRFLLKLTKQFVSSQTNTTARLQIMTIHKAKGLEFDCVILPGLDRRTRANDTQLLLWSERTQMQTEADLILAPIKAIGQLEDPVYRFLQMEEQQKSHYESARLLYVAVTRAKKQLHLIARIKKDEKTKNFKAPENSSLLSHIWPTLTLFHEYESLNIQHFHDEQLIPTLRRLPLTWQSPINLITWKNEQPFQTITLNESIHQHLLRQCIGTIAHAELYQLSQQKTLTHTTSSLRWKHQLQQLGISDSEQLKQGIDTISSAIFNTLSDARGQWILNASHEDAHSEFQLNFSTMNQTKHLIIDRTFICDNIRWIIDYKIVSNSDSALDEFLNTQQQNHQKQLNYYAEAMQYLGHHPIHCALYFPLQKAWRAWVYLP